MGRPSGLERVRWKESAISPQPSITPRILAPRAMACSRLSSTSAAAPSAMTNPSRFFENGLAAACGGSFAVDSADRSEKRTSDFGIDRAVGADAQGRLRFAAPDRLDAELDRRGARGAGRRQRDRRALGAEPLGQRVGDRAEHEALVEAVEGSGIGAPHQVPVGDRIVGCRRLAATMRRCGHSSSIGGTARNSGPGKSPRAPMPASAIASSAAISANRCDSSGELSSSIGTKSIVPAMRVFKPSVAKARDGVDAGSAGGELAPIVRRADAERGDDAHAGDDDDRTAALITIPRHDLSSLQLHYPLHRTASSSANPSPRQCPTLVTATCRSGHP